jgi:hypothetical protein
VSNTRNVEDSLYSELNCGIRAFAPMPLMVGCIQLRNICRIAAALCLCSASVTGWCTQTPALTSQARIPVPESGFVCSHQYANTFFGFTLPLPKQGHFQPLDLSEDDKPFQHFLFGEKWADKGFTVLIVSATQILGSPDDEAQKAVFLPGTQGKDGPEALSIGGRLFWKSEVEQKTFSNTKVLRVRYATAVPGFVIQFSVSSYNGKLLQALKDSIESIKFFDSAKIKQALEADSRPFMPKAALRRMANAPQLDLTHLDAGSLSGLSYSNSYFGFLYHFPPGWHAIETSQKHPADAEDSSLKNMHERREQASEECMRVLASATRDAGESHPEGFNSRITLIAADPACYAPDLKFPDSVHDKATLEFFAGALVHAFAGTPLMGTGASAMRAADINGHLFFEIPTSKAVPISGSALRRKVHMQFVLTNMRQYWVIWLLESDTESELGKVLRTSISFDSPEH